MTRPDWTAALAEAEAIAAAWARPGEAAPGGTILLFDRDGLRGEASAGQASLQHRIPFTARTPSRFASITKHLFCAFALRQGIDLAAPLGALMPSLPGAIGAVTAGRALSMTGGIPDLLQTYLLCGVPASAAVDAAALDAFTDALPDLDFEPGSEVSYSNTGYRLVEQGLARRGAVFGDWVEGPLNAALGTGLRFPGGWDRPLDGLADGHWREGPGAPWRIGAYGMALSASGALAGSAEDLATWLRALLRGDAPVGDVLARLGTPAKLGDGRASHYGLGLHEAMLAGVRLVGHGGSLPGFKNHFLLEPEAGLGVVLLSNREETEPYAPALRVMARLLGMDPPRMTPAALPEGLFVEEEGPAWLELRDGGATFMGARDTLFAGPDEEVAEALSPYLTMRLRQDGADISGEVGKAPRRFRPVETEARVAASMAGDWHAPGLRARIRIDVAPDGTATAAMGSGPLHRRVPLTPLAADRALMPIGAPPWPGRACLWLRTPDALRIATNRSRVVEFRRA